jgi:serine/threonine protein kinase
MYSLLTGLSVFYDESNVRTVQARVKRGDTAYIDPRYKKKSLAEAKLAEIIARCHHYDPADRPSIFEIVAFLTDALKEVEKHEEQSVDGTKS